MVRYILVTGSRNWEDRELLEKWLDRCRVPGEQTVLYHGGCPTGADWMAECWARRHRPEVTTVIVPADWKTYGRAAGPIRNKKMVETYGPNVHCFLVFSKNYSSGTENTLQHIRYIPKRRGANIIICRQ